VGIDVQIVETPELGIYTERLENGAGDIFLERVAQNDANPSSFGVSFFYSQATGPYARWFSAGPAFDSLLEQSLATPDRSQAAVAAADAMNVAISKEAVVLPIAATNWLFAMEDDVDGFVLHGSARHVRWDTVRRTA
jgi:ABC-type oligopeptide transport system substrate-binding subunit